MAKRSGKSRCDKGKPCGLTCIPRYKICRVGMPDVISKYLTFLSRKANNTPKRFRIKKKNSAVLSPLTTSDQFLKKITETDGFYSPKIKQLHMEIGRIFGGGRHFKRNNEDVYTSKEQEEKFKKIRDNIVRRIGLEKFKDGIDALVKYTKDEFYGPIRDAQRGIFKKNVAEKRDELLKLGSDVERLLAQPEMPRPEIEKFRGYKASPSQVREMVQKAQAQTVLSGSALSSWSSSLGQARKFANLFIDDPSKTERVILRTINKVGVPIESVTRNDKEYEILTTKNVKHRYLGYNQIHSKGITYHVFDLEEIP
jgi:plasmid stabilization system protein ParE